MLAMDWIARVLLIVGGLNWGLVGLFEYDLVASLFGGAESTLAKIVYVLVGLAAVYALARLFMHDDVVVAREA